MSVVELHPEDLFDKFARGLLTEGERFRLEAHLATCSVCRFELDARRDFADVAMDVPFATPGFVPAPPVHGPVSEFRSLAGRPRRRRSALLLGLAAALVAGASLAALSPGVREFVRRDVSAVVSRVSDAKKVRAATPSKPRAEERRESAVAANEPGGASPNTEATAVRIEDLPMAARSKTRSTEGRNPDVGGRTPAALFRAANDARRSGDDSRAVALYRTLETEYPSSEEARLSHATLGRLMLDRGDAEHALADFDRYLSQGGTALGEEALVGRALALGKLGARDEEVLAWREVLRRFPRSVHSKLARTRLSALGDP